MKSAWAPKLEAAIRAAVENAGEKETADSIAKTLFRNEKKLVEAWALEKLISEVRREMKAQPDPRQMLLPGFRSLRATLPFRGKTIVLGKATLSVLKRALGTIRENARTESPKVKRIENLIETMEPYAKKMPGLTVERFHEILRAKVEVGELV